MATAVTMPQLGESVTEGVVGRWLKAEGDSVERDEPLLEIITDKVNAEMPSPLAGTLVKIVVPEGATVPVGGELARIEAVGQQPSEQRDASSAPDAAVLSHAPVVAEGAAAPASGRAPDGDDAAGRRRYSPLVRRLAEEHHVDLSLLKGSGLAGRVTKDDVLAYVANQAAPPPSAAPAMAPVAPAESEARTVAPVAAEETSGGDQIMPLTPMRRAIAEHMVRSVQTAPHATALIEVDMTRFVRWRASNGAAAQERHGADISYLAFVIAATTGALRAFPTLNATWGGDNIVLKRRINVGVAVGLEDGLVVPVIHDADEKSVVGLARAVADLAERARAGRLTLPDMQQGTFTVNNVGVFGVVVSTPVINQPQAGILAMHAIVERPVVIDDAIAIRAMMNLSLSFDHRIVDGLLAGRFLQRVAQNLAAIDLESL